MKHVGILLAGAHYPKVSPDPGQLDGQLRRYLDGLGCAPESISVFSCFEGDMPRVGQCEAWIVSGTPLLWTAGAAFYEAFLELVEHEVRQGRPVFGLNHGEQVLVDALCPEAGSPTLPRTLRNPFRSFWISDVLYQVENGRLVGAPRPAKSRNYRVPVLF